MRKRVVHVIPDMPPCGAEMVVLTYLRKFKYDPDYQVSVISLSYNQHRLYEQIAEKEGLDVIYLNQNICDNRLLSRFRQIQQLHKALLIKRPNIIHIHLSILWLVCFAAVGTKVNKIFHTLHSDPEKTSYGIHVSIDRLCYILFNVKPFALNEEMKDKANKLFKINTTRVLYNGIDIELYKNLNRRLHREQYGISDDCFVLGHVGRFNKIKNHKKIIEVFKEVIRLKPLSKLMLVGDGEEMTQIKQLVNSLSLVNDVIFIGTSNEIPKMLSMMDCFIFPSLFEGLGIVLLEAQAAGLRCVVSDTVPKETTVTDNVVRLPLEYSPKIWAQTVLGFIDIKTAPISQSIGSYDINNVIKTLKYYYGNDC